MARTPPEPHREPLRTLSAGAVDVITAADLEAKVAQGRPLRVKLGIDPTASDIHLGFAVVLRKLRQFQDLGHTAVLILGDFTARVGDPSGRSATRPRLSKEEVDAYAQSYLDQVHMILRPDRLELRRNSEWLETMGIEDVLRLASRTTVARMLERDDFGNRYASGTPISVTEFLYPLLQGWDSVMVEADVELGGTDQLFNLLVGRQLQSQEHQEPQAVLTMPLLVGLDGTQKMSKSLGNAVGISEPAPEQFGKLMSLPDALMPSYLALVTGWEPARVEEVTTALGSGELAPVAAKRLLARTVVDVYHGEGAGSSAEAEFDRVFRDHEAPQDLPPFPLPPEAITIIELLTSTGLASSNREARRQVEGGGVRVGGEKVTDPDRVFAPQDLAGTTLQFGRRRGGRFASGG